MVLIESFINFFQNFITEFSYLGVFLVSVISSSTILIPFPIYAINFFAAGLGLNPLLVGILTGIGTAIGELTGYFIGLGGRYMIQEKKGRFIKKVSMLFKKYGFWLLVATSFIPFPFDIVGIVSGMGRYNIKKFIIAVSIGKSARMILFSYAGFFGLHFLIDFFKIVI